MIRCSLRGHLWLSLIMTFAAGCTFTAIPQATPTLVDIPATATPSQTASPTASPTRQAATATPSPIVEPTATPLPASATPTPTDTPGPFEHEIANNETLGYIIQLYGHDYSNDAINAVVLLNENIPNPDTLPPAGTNILVPRPTEIVNTVAEANTEDTAPVDAAQPTRTGSDFNTTHIVQEGESLIDIAQQYNTTLEIISQLNPDIGFFGCNFNSPSGGPDCVILINIGQEVTVPAPTPTPTLSPTPSGNETATPTPTFMPPMVVFPPDNGIAQPGIFRLQWVSVGQLAPDQVYLVYLKDITSGNEQVSAFVTRNNVFAVPEELIPRSGETHEFEWWVSVGERNANGQYTNVSGPPEVNTFFWQSTS